MPSSGGHQDALEQFWRPKLNQCSAPPALSDRWCLQIYIVNCTAQSWLYHWRCSQRGKRDQLLASINLVCDLLGSAKSNAPLASSASTGPHSWLQIRFCTKTARWPLAVAYLKSSLNRLPNMNGNFCQGGYLKQLVHSSALMGVIIWSHSGIHCTTGVWQAWYFWLMA